jgi:hypothetical protein
VVGAGSLWPGNTPLKSINGNIGTRNQVRPQKEKAIDVFALCM